MALLKNKFVVVALAGFVIATITWYSFMRDDSAPLLATQDLTQATAVDSDVVGVLLQLRAVSLSGTIFSDPTFQVLQDFGSEIIPEPVGRPNPFAPLGSSVAATTTATTSAATSTATQRPSTKQ